MNHICFLFLAVAGLSAATETGKVVSVAADGWAKIVQADGSTNLLRRFPEGDRKVGWVGRIVRYDAVAEGAETAARGIVPADPEELRRVAEVTDVLRRETPPAASAWWILEATGAQGDDEGVAPTKDTVGLDGGALVDNAGVVEDQGRPRFPQCEADPGRSILRKDTGLATDDTLAGDEDDSDDIRLF
jgi:hypothetical protein